MYSIACFWRSDSRICLKLQLENVFELATRACILRVRLENDFENVFAHPLVTAINNCCLYWDRPRHSGQGTVPHCLTRRPTTYAPIDHQCESIRGTARTCLAQEESMIGSVYVTVLFGDS